jgi:RES domain-containing protein
MRCYRLTRRQHADLSGFGGTIRTGRWHASPAPILYAASSRALAMLETLVHMELTIDMLPVDYVYQVIDITDDLERLNLDDIFLPTGAAADTARYGSRWLAQGRSLALSAPSFVVRQETNIMLNPAHPAIARATSTIEKDVVWDERLFKA